MKQYAPRTADKIEHREQLSTRDIEQMSQAGLTDDKIIAVIRSTGSIFQLSSIEEENLRNAGVSQRVINYMQQTGQ
jgi:hypothetical protein